MKKVFAPVVALRRGSVGPVRLRAVSETIVSVTTYGGTAVAQHYRRVGI
ncbi:hypothetical protein RCH23_002798 [Cryobacterium sp. CAN_C3]|nr:hypothetical protein [Cryobacterium sp. CAN_C3]MEC5155402.1 hypothetical protein [Cryobacterium sp. CAN_C3]